MKMAEYRDLANMDGEKAKGYLVQQYSNLTYSNDACLILKTKNNKVVGIPMFGDHIDSYDLIGEYDNLQEFVNKEFLGSAINRSEIWKIRVFRANDVKGV